MTGPFFHPPTQRRPTADGLRKKKKRKKQAASITGGVRVVEEDGWGGGGVARAGGVDEEVDGALILWFVKCRNWSSRGCTGGRLWLTVNHNPIHIHKQTTGPW